MTKKITPNFNVRFLNADDIDLLMELEDQKWTEDQKASRYDLLYRIAKYPQFCSGAFCNDTGKALASLFTKPAGNAITQEQVSWDTCVSSSSEATHKTVKKSLFGISLSSIDKDAADAVAAFLIPVVLKKGFTAIYLGSPIPGFKKALEKNPTLTAEAYVAKKHPKKPELPYDPQLNYYYQKGFHEIVSVQKEYFPHEKSMNHGVIVKSVLPGHQFVALIKLLPLSWVKNLGFNVFWLLKNPEWIQLNVHSILKQLSKSKKNQKAVLQ